MTIQEAQLLLTQQLSAIYDGREASNIVGWVLEHLTGMTKIDRVVHRDRVLSATQAELLQRNIDDLLKQRPVQYVLGEAWFAGMRFYVDENVLIPRPETEELVEWVVAEVREAGGEAGHAAGADGARNQEAGSGLSILDVGTGSGCIPIALKKQLSEAIVYGADVSEGALEVAKRNAAALEAGVQFLRVDFLQEAAWPGLPAIDILVSNPPYIPVRDKATMHNNVLLHEPHLALFVEDDDPLLFYRHIGQFALQHMASGGRLYVEIHEELGPATVQLFTSLGLTGIVLRQDLQGKDRMVRAVKA
ncbi:peptide chain release factor N(5)-glutamine methyltransferase [Paraflavitalea sp. CAU 1676]|uniref:peptide chain release factor N(5)-glutamine methyltransferase n=1 Tax=Paraflavitalea sp. CAU 1676 TaxID=3032598 RepID=UPI0023DC37A8|nr:peptide chain release factor N(5)-glutamine methyltransferase [Paraflavitalea sp. CAU 1676]MDF2192505.1 peptide chain release factor N(5)-glutamine methyltransferase [Paraflavitalea sp. CAU 1676]